MVGLYHDIHCISILHRNIRSVICSLNQIPPYQWNFAHFFLKLLPMIVILSSITFYNILHRRFEICTQIFHVNPSISASSSFIKILPTSCETRQLIIIEYFTWKIWIWHLRFTWKLFYYWKSTHLLFSINCCRHRVQPNSILLQRILHRNIGFGTQNLPIYPSTI